MIKIHLVEVGNIPGIGAPLANLRVTGAGATPFGHQARKVGEGIFYELMDTYPISVISVTPTSVTLSHGEGPLQHIEILFKGESVVIPHPNQEVAGDPTEGMELI